MSPIGSHVRRDYATSTDVWLTPPEILRAVGPFDLDPCAADFQAWRPFETARESWTWGGLDRHWHGFVWLNPPYGTQTGRWLQQLAKHRHGIALVFARTETGFFHRQVWERSLAQFFFEGRISFYKPNGEQGANAGGPSALIAYSPEGIRRLAESGLKGHLNLLPAAFIVGPDNLPVGTWKDAIDFALAGRTLRLREIYRATEGTSKVREAKANGHNWKAQVRRALQVYFKPVEYGVWSPA